VAAGSTLTLGKFAFPTIFSLVNTGIITLADSTSALELNWNTTTAALVTGLGKFVMNGGRLVIGGTVDNTGSTITLGSTDFNQITLKGSVVGGVIVTNGNTIGFGSSPTLSGVTVRGELDVGSLASGSTLSVKNGLSVFAADGSSPGIVRIRGHASELSVNDAETWDNMSIVFDKQVDTNVGSVNAFGKGAALTLGPNTNVVANGGGVLNGITVQGNVLVQGNGSLITTNTVFASSARIQVAFAGKLAIYGAIATADLQALAGQIVNQGTVNYLGTVNNIGATLDLTPAGVLASISITSDNSNVTGGLILNSGKAVDLHLSTLDSVTLQGAFKIGSAVYNSLYPDSGGGITTLRTSFAVKAADGGAGVLDLLSNNAQMRAETSLTLDAMTILMGNNSSLFGLGSLLTLGKAATTNVVSGAAQIGGIVDNFGTIIVAASTSIAPVSLAVGVPNFLSPTPGTFENDGIIALGAGSSLTAYGTLVNTGTINLAARSSFTVTNASLIGGTIVFQGAGAQLVFASSGADGASVGTFFSGDSIITRLRYPSQCRGNLSRSFRTTWSSRLLRFYNLERQFIS